MTDIFNKSLKVNMPAAFSILSLIAPQALTPINLILNFQLTCSRSFGCKSDPQSTLDVLLGYDGPQQYLTLLVEQKHCWDLHIPAGAITAHSKHRLLVAGAALIVI